MNRLAFFAIFAVVTLSCRSKTIPLSNATGESITRAQVRGDSAQSHVKQAIPDSSPTGKVHLQTAVIELDWQRGDLVDAKLSLQAERRAAAKLQAAYDALSTRWYVKVGRSIQWFIGIALVLWAGIGIAGAIVGATPLGMGLMRLLPFANPFVWLRSRIHPDTTVQPVTVNVSR